VKLLIDANLSPLWVEFLEKRGFGAIHWYSVGIKNAPDPEIMRYAAEQGYVILTRDLDFGTILAQSLVARPSVAQIRAHPAEPEHVGSQVVSALRDLEAELAAGALVTIDPKRTRARLLPFLAGGRQA
jgi:predicted nuclease of predicted toxin-antitoxin system